MNEDLFEFVSQLRAAGVTEFAGMPTGFATPISLVLGPLPPGPPKPAEAERPIAREPMPPELAKFITPELAADLTATLED